jgi:hypothetical protein
LAATTATKRSGTNECVCQARETNHQKYELTQCGMIDKCGNREIVASCCQKRCSRPNCGNKKSQKRAKYPISVTLCSSVSLWKKALWG